MTDFPLLDAPRTEADAELGRMVLEQFGFIEPHLPELDNWCSMPLRLGFDQAAGWRLEVGPYDLLHADIEKLRMAISAYDRATGGTVR